jgi:hypothetical protein
MKASPPNPIIKFSGKKTTIMIPTYVVISNKYINMFNNIYILEDRKRPYISSTLLFCTQCFPQIFLPLLDFR